MGSTWPAGVNPRDNSIEIRLTMVGKRQYVNLPWRPTPGNITKAGKLRMEAQQAIKFGVFSWEEFFPESKQAKQERKDTMCTFSEYAARYLNVTQVTENSKRKYRDSLERVYLPAFGERDICSIKHSEILDLLASFQWSNKTRNNNLIALRGVFKLAKRDGILRLDPTEGIENAKHQNPRPDPLSVEEMEVFLEWVRKTQHPMWFNYFEYSLFSGLRPSEQIALQWQNVDFFGRYVRVSQSKILGKIRTHTKTYSERDVEFNQRSEAALKRQKEWTYLADKEVFVHPSTGEPFTNNNAIRQMWTRGLKACGIRHRNSYQMRHTFCTNCLAAGANIHWVSSQLGHSTAVMTLTRYAKWIEQARVQKQPEKLDNFIKGCKRE